MKIYRSRKFLIPLARTQTHRAPPPAPERGERVHSRLLDSHRSQDTYRAVCEAASPDHPFPCDDCCYRIDKMIHMRVRACHESFDETHAVLFAVNVSASIESTTACVSSKLSR
ncbi:hypothetical protein VTO73DRAFT_2420 [Trametes versicolor]